MLFESVLAVIKFFLSLLGFVVIGLYFSSKSVVQSAEKEALPKSDCEVVSTQDNKQQAVYFTQQVFEENWHELAIIAQGEQQFPIIKRITYHEKQTPVCHFPAIAISRAGDWGWYLAWALADKAYYARMDGEALVFSPPKLLPVSQVKKIEFLTDTNLPAMRVMTLDGKTQWLTSDDEGRHWQVMENLP